MNINKNDPPSNGKYFLAFSSVPKIPVSKFSRKSKVRNSKRLVNENFLDGTKESVFEHWFLIFNDTNINISITIPEPTIWSNSLTPKSSVHWACFSVPLINYFPWFSRINTIKITLKPIKNPIKSTNKFETKKITIPAKSIIFKIVNKKIKVLDFFAFIKNLPINWVLKMFI